jgi:hypothetical protein
MDLESQVQKIEAKELRVGNLVTTTDILIPNHIIKAEDIVSIADGSFSKLGVDIFPLKLTKTILYGFGFEYYKPLNQLRMVVDDIWYSVRFKDGHWYFRSVNLKFCESAELYPICVDYTHKLQNLFFALCGKELTLKEKV